MTVGVLMASAPRSRAMSSLTLPTIMLVSSPMASSTSALTSAKSVMSMRPLSRRATSPSHETTPDPFQRPVRPISETTDPFGPAVCGRAPATVTSTFSIVRQTLAVCCAMSSDSRSTENVVMTGSSGDRGRAGRDLFFDFFRGERLAHVAAGAEAHGFHHPFGAAFGRDHDEAHGGPFRAGAHGRQQLQPVHVRHVDVAQHERRRRRL